MPDHERIACSTGGGDLRAPHFGQVHDLIVGAEIATLLGEGEGAAI